MHTCKYKMIVCPHSAIRCPALVALDNAAVSYSSDVVMSEIDFGTVATFNCSLGFSLVGEPESVCSGDGSSTVGVFDPDPPICERKIYKL